mgnify:CR=1 FL=1
MIQNLIDLQKNIENNHQDYILIYNRKEWESEILKSLGYYFSKSELDLAEKSNTKLIRVVDGVKCYLTISF